MEMARAYLVRHGCEIYQHAHIFQLPLPSRRFALFPRSAEETLFEDRSEPSCADAMNVPQTLPSASMPPLRMKTTRRYKTLRSLSTSGQGPGSSPAQIQRAAQRPPARFRPFCGAHVPQGKHSAGSGSAGNDCAIPSPDVSFSGAPRENAGASPAERPSEASKAEDMP